MARDTARDIILGTNPSGQGPRAPREGRVTPQPRSQPPRTAPPPIQQVRPRKAPSPQPPKAEQQQYNNGYAPPPPDDRGNRVMMEEVMRLTNSFRAFQRSQEDALSHEQEARRRLEAQLKASQDNMGRLNERLRSGEGSGRQVNMQDLEESKRARANMESALIRLTQELGSIKATVERHSSDLMLLNNEVKSRPQIDPSKLTNNQVVDGRMRDLHGEIMGLRTQLDSEINERRKYDQEQQLNLQKMQQALAGEDQRKSDLLKQLAMKGDQSTKQMSEEQKRLNEKIQYITDEVTRNMTAKEQAIRDENNQKYLALEKAIKAELEARLQYEKEIRSYLEGKWKGYNDEIDELKTFQTNDKQKFKEKFQKLNEALAILERHLEQGGNKMGRVVAAEIQSRKLHEKGLLAKLTEVEDKLAGHLGSMNRAIDEAKRGGSAKSVQNLDTDQLKRDMEVIAADKHKLSMEGLLKLEEKMQRIERGLDRDSREIKDKVESFSQAQAEAARPKTPEEPKGKKAAAPDNDAIARIRHQLRKLDDTQEEIERAHDRVREKVERQIPEDLNDLAMKLDNSKKQLNDRVDKEEQERYAAIKEIQDEVSKLRARPGRDVGAPAAGAAAAGPALAGPVAEQMQKEVDECKIGIKKLAEAVTTVKNVLDRRINEETRAREKEIAKLDNVAAKWKAASTT